MKVEITKGIHTGARYELVEVLSMCNCFRLQDLSGNQWLESFNNCKLINEGPITKVISLVDLPFIKKGYSYEVIRKFSSFYIVIGSNGELTKIDKQQAYTDTDMVVFNLNKKGKRITDKLHEPTKKPKDIINLGDLLIKILKGIELNSIEKLAIISLIDEEDSRWNYKG